MAKHPIDKMFEQNLRSHPSDLPQGLWDKISEELEEKPKAIWYQRRSNQYLAVAASLVILILSVGVWQNINQDTQIANSQNTSESDLALTTDPIDDKKPKKKGTSKSSNTSPQKTKKVAPKKKKKRRAPSIIIPSRNASINIAQKDKKQPLINDSATIKTPEKSPEIKDNNLANNTPKESPKEITKPSEEESFKVVVTVKLANNTPKPSKQKKKGLLGKLKKREKQKEKKPIEIFGVSPGEALAAIGKGEK